MMCENQYAVSDKKIKSETLCCSDGSAIVARLQNAYQTSTDIAGAAARRDTHVRGAYFLATYSSTSSRNAPASSS